MNHQAVQASKKHHAFQETVLRIHGLRLHNLLSANAKSETWWLWCVSIGKIYPKIWRLCCFFNRRSFWEHGEWGLSSCSSHASTPILADCDSTPQKWIKLPNSCTSFSCVCFHSFCYPVGVFTSACSIYVRHCSFRWNYHSISSICLWNPNKENSVIDEGSILCDTSWEEVQPNLKTLQPGTTGKGVFEKRRHSEMNFTQE